MLNILFLLAQVVLFSSCYEVTPIGDVKTKLGECPHYNVKTNSLYYTDVWGEYPLLRYDLTEKEIYRAKIKGVTGRPGFVLPIEDRHNKFLVAVERDLKVVKWDGESKTAEAYCTQIQVEKHIPTNLVHDGKVDSHGRLYFGTIRDDMCNPNSTAPFGGLWRSDDAKTLKQLVWNLGITNDFAIDEKRNILYLVHSCNKSILAYDWDPDTGDLCNERVSVNFPAEMLKQNPLQAPDGLKLDNEGKIWVTANGGSAVVRFDPDTGEVLLKVTIPGKLAQALAFGGENMDILFVTTTSAPFSTMTGLQLNTPVPPSYGTLYQITGLGVQGLPAIRLDKDFATCAPEKSIKRFFRRNHDDD